MKTLWSKRIKDLEAYVPGEQPKDKKYIKLNTNENPYPPSPKAVEAMKNAVGADLRLYPDPDCSALTETIASVFGIDREEVFVGNGSDEVLSMCFPAFFDEDRLVLFPDISYSFYPVYAALYNIPYETVPLKSDFTICADDYLRANGGILFANPNAPTSIALSAGEIEKIIAGNPDSVVIVDEAYIDFGGESVLPLIGRYKNLLVIRTTSKSYSLAGLRVGWAMGDRSLIAALNTVKNSINSYTLDRAAIAGAAAAIGDRAYFNKCCESIISTRGRTAKALEALGFDVMPSSTNFVFARPSGIGAEELFKALRENSVLVRYFKKPRISDYLRISIGTDEEMDEFISAVKRIIK